MRPETSIQEEKMPEEGREDWKAGTRSWKDWGWRAARTPPPRLGSSPRSGDCRQGSGLSRARALPSASEIIAHLLRHPGSPGISSVSPAGTAPAWLCVLWSQTLSKPRADSVVPSVGLASR